MIALAAVDTLPTPSIQYALLAPILIVLGGGVVGVLVEAFAPQRFRRTTQLVVTFGTLVLAGIALLAANPTDQVIAQGLERLARFCSKLKK